MDNNRIDHIIESLFVIMPVLHRKILRMNLKGISSDLTRLHLGIMKTLHEADMTVSDLARMSIVPKPQMTHLIDQLVDLGIVERHPDGLDRRVIHISMTEKGHTLHKDMKHKVREAIKKELAGLTPQELAEMSKALETLRRIADKIS
jgi:DNA-binding MarR family transcriptional regulator